MGADGQIQRVKLKFERDFTQIPNEWLRDAKLTLKARGLLAQLMSHDAGYTVSIKSLTATNPEGRSAIDAAVQELKEQGYLRHELIRGRYGRLEGVVWQLTDPAEARARHAMQPQLDSPDAGFSDTRTNQHPEDLHLKEANPEEDLPTERANVGSTRARAEEDASGDSPRAAADRACPAHKRTGHHVFNTQDPHERCYHCGRVDLEGRVFDLDGHELGGAA